MLFAIARLSDCAPDVLQRDSVYRRGDREPTKEMRARRTSQDFFFADASRASHLRDSLRF
jgi:hypothetical protein